MRTHTMRFLCATLLFALMLIMSGCALLPKEEARRTAPLVRQAAAEEFKTSFVQRGNMELTKKIGCTYVPIQKVSLYFQVSGEYVDEMFVQAGDHVTAGTLLGQLRLDGVEDSIRDCETQIQSLSMQLTHLDENLEVELKRQRLINSSGGAALDEALKNAREAHEKSRQSLTDSLVIAKLRLDTLLRAREARQLVAPIDGTVTYVRKYSESSVSSMTERAITIADSTMSLFTASTEYWEHLHAGDNVVITVSKVDYEAVVADETALGLPAEERVSGKKAKMYFTLVTPTFDLEDNDKGTMVLLLDSREDVLMVNEDAISRAEGETIVYYQDEQGMKTYKPVSLGLNANGFYEVLEGLGEGEEVIVG